MLKLRVTFRVVALTGFCLLLMGSVGTIDAQQLKPPSIHYVPKPIPVGPERRARSQPSVPSNYREIPFEETAPVPVLSDAEKQQGYLLFQRPIMEPVYPNTRPLFYERLERLIAFGTPGEFEPVSFSVYPVRSLKNFHVRVSDLVGSNGKIDTSQLNVYLVTYWNIGYPRYTSWETYRRLPELLEEVTAHSSPAEECQRWWIRIHVPEDATAGLYNGTVTLWDDGFDKAIAIPLSLRVLGFKLESDPAKHYSSYYYVRNTVQYRGKDERFVNKATGNEYRAMIEYGLDMLPTFSLQMDDQNKKILVRHEQELERMLKVGLKGPLPVTGGNVIARIYRQTTPGGKRENHWKISKMPPPEFYEKVKAVFKAFQEECQAKGWPEVICCPIDEVAASHKEFGWRVYKAVHESGIRTYATKNPVAADAEPYRPYIDIWCSQPYSIPYEKITAQHRYEYWCYPNHNAGEIKDRRVMCKGGRMTYGFGFWKSGYTTLIPWNWNWTPAPDQFDYLRGSRSGCGQRIGDDGQVIPAVYWECFREGRDDARYIYTLQQAVYQRESSQNPQCRRLIETGKALLQEMWDAIEVQQKYLAENMWPSQEFNARRWRLAMMIDELLQFPAVKKGNPPSVLVPNTVSRPSSPKTSLIDSALQQNLVDTNDLLEPLSDWRNDTKEGRVEVTTAAGQEGKKGLRWRIKVDHLTDGGEGGKYPVGWPRLHRNFPKGELDLSQYDYLEFNVRVDSNRDEVADDHTPLGFLIASHQKSRQFFSKVFDIGDRQRVWIPVRFPVQELIQTAGMGVEPWKTISKVQLYISEKDFKHGTDLTIDLSSVKLFRFTSPMISELHVPRYMILPRTTFPVFFEAIGLKTVQKDSHQVNASLIDKQKETVSYTRQDLATHQPLVLDISNLMPGQYTVKMEIKTKDGKPCSERVKKVEALQGPLQ